jgi:hypothetical protein
MGNDNGALRGRYPLNPGINIFPEKIPINRPKMPQFTDIYLLYRLRSQVHGEHA